jgi:hypothetical protein
VFIIQKFQMQHHGRKTPSELIVQLFFASSEAVGYDPEKRGEAVGSLAVKSSGR